DRRRGPGCPPHRRTARPGRPDPRAQPESTKGTRMTTSGVLQVAVERVAADAPATVGWIDGTATRTYGELDGTADHLADRLRRRGIGTGDIVALLLARGPDMLVAMLGVLKTGAAYLPLSLDDPPARREHLLRDSAAAAVVAHGATRDLLTTDRP